MHLYQRTLRLSVLGRHGYLRAWLQAKQCFVHWYELEDQNFMLLIEIKLSTTKVPLSSKLLFWSSPVKQRYVRIDDHFSLCSLKDKSTTSLMEEMLERIESYPLSPYRCKCVVEPWVKVKSTAALSLASRSSLSHTPIFLLSWRWK